MKKFIENALYYAKHENYIVPNKVNEYVSNYASDKRYRLCWLARDSYKGGCSIGVIKYKHTQYYFYISGNNIHVELN